MSKKSVLDVLTHSPGTAIGVSLVVIHLLSALFGFLFVPYGPTELAGVNLLAPGSPGFPLGTDVIGRDYLTRLVLGGRTSIFVAMLGAMIAVVVGGFIGVSAAYIGGFYDDVIMRLVDIKLSIPGILLWRYAWLALADPFRCSQS